jgi:hypothetical protein
MNDLQKKQTQLSPTGLLDDQADDIHHGQMV